jgi:hypothetical protein
MLGAHIPKNPAGAGLELNLTLGRSWILAISLSPGQTIGDFHQA